jgi:hypothetical protein
VSRNATKSSDNKRTRTGEPSAAGNSSGNSAGSQNRLSNSPMGVPGPVRVNVSFSSALSMFGGSFRCKMTATFYPVLNP